MAILTRHKSTIYGLNSDLLALQNADTTLQNNIDAVDDKVTATQANLDLLESNTQTAISNEAYDRAVADTALGVRIDNVETTATSNLAEAKTYADTIVAALADGRVTDLEDLMEIVNGDATVVGSFRKAIADVIGTAPEVLDTLGEIATALNNDPDLYNTLTTMVSTNIEAAKAAIKGEVSEAFDTLAEVEDAIEVINGDAATVGSIAKAEADAKAYADSLVSGSASTLQANIDQVASDLAALDADTYSKAETDSAIAAGGAIFTTETLLVTADKITLTNAPKNGMIFNFATVRHTDANFVSYDIPVTVTATAGGKEFQLHPNTTGEFDGKNVTVQYAYVPVA